MSTRPKPYELQYPISPDQCWQLDQMLSELYQDLSDEQLELSLFPIDLEDSDQVEGILPVGNGGTGIDEYTIGDLLYASAAAVLSKLAAVATGNALISGGVGAAPSWGKVGLTTHISGTLPIANGGTGQTSQTPAFDALAPTTTAGDVIYHNGTDNVRLALGTAAQVLTVNAGATAPEWAAASGGAGVQDGYWSPLTNGDGSSPELIFDGNGDTVAVWTET
jgi:hypothetical protein